MKYGKNVQLHRIPLEKNSSGRLSLAINKLNIYLAKLRSILNHCNMKTYDVTCDIHQNLYVSDVSNSCVHVFTNNSVFLRSICHDKEELKYPWGLCVHGQYVYVTELISHCVFVFTTDGE